MYDCVCVYPGNSQTNSRSRKSVTKNSGTLRAAAHEGWRDVRPMAAAAGDAIEKLRATLATDWARVRDVFSAWDEDQSGQIDKREWEKALAVMYAVPADVSSAVFESLDTDGSGSLDYREVHKAIRQGASIELDASLRDGAAGEIETGAHNRHALRKEGPQTTHSRVVQIQLSEGGSILEQITNALAGSWSRVRELFIEFDTDGDGTVSKRELFRALALLGLTGTTRAESDALFDSLDADASGTLEFKELHHALGKRATVELDSKLRAGAVAFEQTASNRIAIRKTAGKKGSRVVGGVQLRSADAASVVGTLRQALAANLARTIDLFREWDADASGTIDKQEFCRAIATLGLKASEAESVALFNLLDDDLSGSIEYHELQQKLRRGAGGLGKEGQGASAFVAPFFRGPPKLGERLQKALLGYGKEFCAACQRVAGDAGASASADGASALHHSPTRTSSEENVLVGASDFVRAVESLAPLTANGKPEGPLLVVKGNELHEELARLFSRLQLDAGTDRIQVKSLLPRLRALSKAGSASPRGGGAAGAAMMGGEAAAHANIKPPVDRLRILLASAAASAVALFRSMDVDETGVVTRAAFRRALPQLHISASRPEADALFDMVTPLPDELAYASLEALPGRMRLPGLKAAHGKGQAAAGSPRAGGPVTLDQLGPAYFLPAIGGATGSSSKHAAGKQRQAISYVPARPARVEALKADASADTAAADGSVATNETAGRSPRRPRPPPPGGSRRVAHPSRARKIRDKSHATARKEPAGRGDPSTDTASLRAGAEDGGQREIVCATEEQQCAQEDGTDGRKQPKPPPPLVRPPPPPPEPTAADSGMVSRGYTGVQKWSGKWNPLPSAAPRNRVAPGVVTGLSQQLASGDGRVAVELSKQRVQMKKAMKKIKLLEALVEELKDGDAKRDAPETLPHALTVR